MTPSRRPGKPRKTVRGTRKSPGKFWVKVAKAADLREGKPVKFPLERDGLAREGFAYLWKGEVKAFLNECRHWTVGLDLDDNRFFTPDGRYLICANHGALYEPSDGHCLSGPCQGASLEPLPVIRRGAFLYAENRPGTPPA